MVFALSILFKPSCDFSKLHDLLLSSLSFFHDFLVYIWISTCPTFLVMSKHDSVTINVTSYYNSELCIFSICYIRFSHIRFPTHCYIHYKCIHINGLGFLFATIWLWNTPNTETVAYDSHIWKRCGWLYILSICAACESYPNGWAAITHGCFNARTKWEKHGWAIMYGGVRLNWLPATRLWKFIGTGLPTICVCSVISVLGYLPHIHII